MRDIRNPFRLQYAESIETDADFLRLFGPAVLDLLPNSATQGKPLFIRSAPGGGKTSLLRIFTPSVLQTLLRLRSSEQYKEVFTKAKSLEVIDDTKILVLAIMLTSRQTFSALSDLGLAEVRVNRLFLALLDARIVMGALRSALIARRLRYPDDLSQITIDALPDDPPIPGLDLPCDGKQLRAWAEKLERAVCDVIDSLMPPGNSSAPGHDCLHSLRLLDANAIKVGGTSPAERWLVLLDDVHKLTRKQRQKLSETLLEQRSATSTWIAERLEALSQEELLANGALERRDYGEVVNLEDAWESRQFEKAATGIAERRAKLASDVATGAQTPGSFAASLDSNLDSLEFEKAIDDALNTVKNRVTRSVTTHQKYRQWLRVRTEFNGATFDKLVAWRALEILIERDIRKSQMSFDFELPPKTLEEREDSSVRAAADLFIASEFNFPYYYGNECVARLGSYNIEQFLRLAGDLFEESLSAALIKKSAVLPPQRQEELLLSALESRLSELPRRASNGRDVLRFIEAVGKFCHDETYRPNAPYSPGVTGIAISMVDRDRLLNEEFLKKNPEYKRFAEMLGTTLAQNVFLASLDYKVKGGRYMVLYLNRLVCMKYRLPLQYGGFREKPLRNFVSWLEEGVQSIPLGGTAIMSHMNAPLRWQDYFMRRGDGFTQFWEQFLSEKRNLLFILGHGFDTRMCDCANAILNLGKEGIRDALVVEYDEGPQSPSQQYSDQRAANGRQLKALFENRGTIIRRKVGMFSVDGRRIGDRNIAKEFKCIDEFLGYTDVVVDISAMPRSLYFPLLAKIMMLFDQAHQCVPQPNLHVVVSHSTEQDSQIVDEGIDEAATYLFGFAAASFELEATRDQPRIWIPLLGGNQSVQLEKVYELVQPDEICPLLPSPARNPRNSDDIVLEYRELLFDQLRVEPRNFIYAAEANPFEVYRQIMRSVRHYLEALEPLGGCKIVVSAMSSKLLSLGALLAAYELFLSRHGEERVEVGVGHVDAHGYSIKRAGLTCRATECYTMWLFGECYASQ